MVLTLSIPDELYQDYVKINPQNPHKAIVRQLERFKTALPSDRGIWVTGKELSEIQRAAGRQVETPEDIERLVTEALKLNFDGIDLKLTAGQRARLTQDATFWGRNPNDYASEIAKELFANRFGV